MITHTHNRQSLTRDRQWLLGSTARNHESLKLELSGTWEPLISQSTARSCEALESQNYLPLGDKIKNKTYEVNKKHNWRGK